MTTHLKILAALLIFTATTWAGGSELDAAVQREREASTRVWYYETQTTIAERDVETAQITLQLATMERVKAVNENRTADANKWAKRHAEASRDERAAQAKLTWCRRHAATQHVDNV